MKLDLALFMKALSPRFSVKALQAFDRATTIVVAACWGGALLMLVFSIYTISLSVSAKRAVEAATATEPNLPKITHRPIDKQAMGALVDRLKHSYPDIKFEEQNQALTVNAIDGSKFREWLTALSYIDTISPQYHWSIKNFCVGKCRNDILMHATLEGETILFQLPSK